jgi:hypothetical protein
MELTPQSGPKIVAILESGISPVLSCSIRAAQLSAKPFGRQPIISFPAINASVHTRRGAHGLGSAIEYSWPAIRICQPPSVAVGMQSRIPAENQLENRQCLIVLKHF